MSRCGTDERTNDDDEQGKIGLLSLWMLEGWVSQNRYSYIVNTVLMRGTKAIVYMLLFLLFIWCCLIRRQKTLLIKKKDREKFWYKHQKETPTSARWEFQFCLANAFDLHPQIWNSCTSLNWRISNLHLHSSPLQFLASARNVWWGILNTHCGQFGPLRNRSIACRWKWQNTKKWQNIWPTDQSPTLLCCMKLNANTGCCCHGIFSWINWWFLKMASKGCSFALCCCIIK